MFLTVEIRTNKQTVQNFFLNITLTNKQYRWIKVDVKEARETVHDMEGGGGEDNGDAGLEKGDG